MFCTCNISIQSDSLELFPDFQLYQIENLEHTILEAFLSKMWNIVIWGLFNIWCRGTEGKRSIRKDFQWPKFEIFIVCYSTKKLSELTKDWNTETYICLHASNTRRGNMVLGKIKCSRKDFVSSLPEPEHWKRLIFGSLLSV